MNEWIAGQTALPNLHPALVHFPIALIPLATLFDLLAAGWARGRDWLARAGTLTWALAALATGATYWAGRQAADSLVGLSPQVQARISSHSDWGLYVLWSVGLIVTVRLTLSRWRPEHRVSALTGAVLGLGATALVVQAADLGGALVYQHGVAVAVEAPAEPPSQASEFTGTEASMPAPGPLERRLLRSAEGALEWRPLAGDAGALGVILEPLGETDAVTVGATADAEVEGLPLEVEGKALLALPQPYGDVQVDAEVDLSAFRGTFGLAHHTVAADRAGMLRVQAPGGELALVTLRGESPPKVLDSAERPLPDGTFDLGVYAAGRHLRGMVGGETVLHGHEPALPDGRVGLFFDGEGRVVVRSLTVTPIRP